MHKAISFVEGEAPVTEGNPETGHTPEAPEAAVVLLCPSDNLLMSSVAEGGVRRHFAVAQLEVARFRDIESHGSAPGDDPLALAVAEGVDLRMTARAPVVRLAAVQVDVSGEDTSVGRHTWGSVLALLVGARLSEFNNPLSREVGHIVTCKLLARDGVRLQQNWFGSHNVSLVGLHLIENGTKIINLIKG